MAGLDEEKLLQNNEEELKKFRTNLISLVFEVMGQEEEEKRRSLEALKMGALSMIAQIPVLTPVVTAMLQVILSDDMGLRMTLGFKMLSNKMDAGFTMMAECFYEMASAQLADNPEERKKHLERMKMAAERRNK